MDLLGQIRDTYTRSRLQPPGENLERVLRDVKDLFEGRAAGFQHCDTPYHNLEHSLETTAVMIRIMDGWNKGGRPPPIAQDFFDLGVIAALLHDVGYIKKSGDNSGTGAKYTFRHVGRGVALASRYLSSLGYTHEATHFIQTLIWHTYNKTHISEVTYSCDEEKWAAFSLGTADLLAQMSAPDYLDKLPLLFEEFKEGYAYEGIAQLREKGHKVFESLDEMIRGTPAFYENWVKPRFREMGSVCLVIEPRAEKGKNDLLAALEKNMDRISS